MTGVTWEEKIGGKLSPARFLPPLNKVASARRGTSSNATPLVLDEFMYSMGCEHAPGEGGVKRETGKRGKGGDHRLASG